MIPTVTYGLIYTVPFKSIKDNSFLIEIYKRDYTGISTELIGSVSPFVITIEDGCCCQDKDTILKANHNNMAPEYTTLTAVAVRTKIQF